MSELFLVRHAKASFGEANYDQLSEIGYRQARWLGEHFRERGVDFDRVITGDMVRHRQTWEGIAAGMQRPETGALIRPGWNEFDFQRLVEAYLQQFPNDRPPAGATSTDFYRLLKAALLAWSSDRLTGELPEDWCDFERRVRAMLAELQNAAAEERVLVVSSGGAIAMALRQVLMAPPETMVQLNLQIRNASVSRCFFSPRGYSVHTFNHIAHLETPERMRFITYS
jgi:broad specificity phosphatase PhoE